MSSEIGLGLKGHIAILTAIHIYLSNEGSD